MIVNKLYLVARPRVHLPPTGQQGVDPIAHCAGLDFCGIIFYQISTHSNGQSAGRSSPTLCFSDHFKLTACQCEFCLFYFY